MCALGGGGGGGGRGGSWDIKEGLTQKHSLAFVERHPTAKIETLNAKIVLRETIFANIRWPK